MAHELNYNKQRGSWSFASHSEVAWHGLGQIVDKAMTTEEAIQLANLDYQVAKTQVFMKTEAGIDVPIEGYFSTYRTDTNDTLGMVRSRYEIVQNKDAFAFFDTIIDSGEAIFETAGVLGKGERIFLIAKLPDDFVIGGEKIEKYILLTNSHDGTSSVIAGLTHVRVVCNNTLQAALQGLENKVSISHINGAQNRIKEASKLMGIASTYSHQVKELFSQMVDYKMDEDKYRNYFTKVLTPDYISRNPIENKEASSRLKNLVDMTMEFATTHPTQTTLECNGTLWGGYNAISGIFNYVKPYKNSEDKFNNQFFGNANKKMIKSFNEAVVLL